MAEVVVYIAESDTGLEDTFETLIEDGGLSHAIVTPEPGIGGGNTRDDAARRVAAAITAETHAIVWDMRAPINSKEEGAAVQRLQEMILDAGKLGTRRLVLLTDRTSEESQSILLGRIHGLLPRDSDESQPQVVFLDTGFDIENFERAIGIPSPDAPVEAPARRTPPSKSIN